MKKKIFTISVLTILLSILTTGIASAQTVTFGVSTGETYDYSYRVNWTSTDPSANPPEYLAVLNETTLIQVKIIDISGSVVNLKVTRTLANGTQIVNTGTVNILTADINVPYGHLIVRANINANEVIYPAGGNQIIERTFMTSYLTGQRETNKAISKMGSDKMTVNYDKIKGVAVDYSLEMVEASDGFTSTTTETLINTNSGVWAIAPTPTPSSPGSVIPEVSLFAVPFVLAATSAAVLLIKRAGKLPLKL